MAGIEKDKDNVIDRPTPPPGIGEEIDTVDRTKLKKPHNYNVLFLNDDFTPMDFVVDLLVGVFNHGLDKAVVLMQEVHKKGKAIVGTYSYEVAEMKVYESMKKAQKAQHPLQVVMDKA